MHDFRSLLVFSRTQAASMLQWSRRPCVIMSSLLKKLWVSIIIHVVKQTQKQTPVWPVSKLSIESVGSRRELAANSCTHRLRRRDKTVSSRRRRRCVLGIIQIHVHNCVPVTDRVLLVCTVQEPEPKVFHQCGTNTTQRFEMNDTCLISQVIRIQSAKVGFSDPCPSDEAICTRTTNHTGIMRCNGKRGCSFTQDVLNYSAFGGLCDQHQNGNFIRIIYRCINGKYTIKVKKERIAVNGFPFHSYTGRRLPYGITQCYQLPDTSERVPP